MSLVRSLVRKTRLIWLFFPQKLPIRLVFYVDFLEYFRWIFFLEKRPFLAQKCPFLVEKRPFFLKVKKNPTVFSSKITKNPRLFHKNSCFYQVGVGNINTKKNHIRRILCTKLLTRLIYININIFTIIVCENWI